MAKRNFWRDTDAKVAVFKDVPRHWGPGYGTQIVFEAEEQVIQDYIAAGDLDSAIQGIHAIDGPGRSVSLTPPYLPTLGTNHFIRRVIEILETQKRTAELIRFLKRVVSDRKRFLFASQKRLSDPEVQRRPKLVATREQEIQEARRCLLEANRLYRESLHRIGDVAEFESVNAEMHLIESGALFPPPQTSYDPDRRQIDEPMFWELINRRHDFESDDDWIADLTARLQSFCPSQIVAFQRMLYRKMNAAYRNDIWAVAYISGRAESDDSFEYFCSGLVARGRAHFEAALDQPPLTVEGLADDDDGECERLLSAAADAYANLTSEDLTDKVVIPIFKARGRPWEPDQLPMLFPELCLRHGFVINE